MVKLTIPRKKRKVLGGNDDLIDYFTEAQNKELSPLSRDIGYYARAEYITPGVIETLKKEMLE